MNRRRALLDGSAEIDFRPEAQIPPMSFDQGQFNFDANGPEDGYRRWREELDAARKVFERRWGVILSRRVSVMLENHSKPLVGLLRVVPDSGKKPGTLPEFEMGGLRFKPNSIQSIVQLEDAERSPD